MKNAKLNQITTNLETELEAIQYNTWFKGLEISDELIQKQLDLEVKMLITGQEKYAANNERNQKGEQSSTTHYSYIIKNTVAQLADFIEAYVSNYSNRRGTRQKVAQILGSFNKSVAASVALKSVIDLITADLQISNLFIQVGKRLENQYRFSTLEEKAPNYFAAIKKDLDSRGSKSYTHKERTFNAALQNSGVEVEKWSDETVATVGAALVELVSQVEIKSQNRDHNGKDKFVKLFHIVSETRNNKTVTFLEPTSALTDFIDNFTNANEFRSPSFSPCVIPPLDWESPTYGGFYLPEIRENHSLVRNARGLERLHSYENMPMVYEAVNRVQKVAYQVSSEPLEVLLQVIEYGLPIGIPCSQPAEIMPAPIPEGLEDLKGKELTAAMTSTERKAFADWCKYAAKTRTANKKQAFEYSQVLKRAKAYQEFSVYDAIYFVWSFDNRSRMYCDSTDITPQGDDLQKGLLRFAEGKALGAEGRFWLAMQGAGVWAVKDENGKALDKKSMKVRYDYINNPEFSEMVTNIANDPLEFKDWTKADKPWQFLNWCFEWADLLDHESNGLSSETFVSHLPIAQDGSCSGTQHYAAILRDTNTARMVNLLPMAEPMDIYTEGAGLTKNKLAKLIEDECDLGLKLAYSQWYDLVSRNLVKPPIMTKVYAATQRSCRKTTIEYLNDIQAKEDMRAISYGETPKQAHPFEELGNAANVITPVIWESVNELQAATEEGMRFIKRVALNCAKNNTYMQWTTPLGFTVRQERFVEKETRIKTAIQGIQRITLKKKTTEICKYAMQSASAPNFIHSRDASHVLLVAHEAMVNQGIDSIAFIFDSFGTHAADTPKLRKILNETFVEMNKDNCLETLKEENEDRIMEVFDIEDVKYGNLDLNEILKAEYAFN